MANRSIRDSRTGGPSFLERPLLGGGPVAPQQGAPVPGNAGQAAFAPRPQPLPRPAPTLGASPPAMAGRPGELPKPAGRTQLGPVPIANRPPMPPAPMPGATGPGTANPGNQGMMSGTEPIQPQLRR